MSNVWYGVEPFGEMPVFWDPLQGLTWVVLKQVRARLPLPSYVSAGLAPAINTTTERILNFGDWS